MKVKNRIFYHTAVDVEAENYLEHTKPLQFKIGDINRRSKKNLINYKPIANLQNKGIQLTWLKYLDYLIENFETHKTPPDNWHDLLKNMTYTCYNLNSRYWEKIFEEIRIENYSDLPSRLSCLYLADKENIERWHKKALDDLEAVSLPIYELSVTGDIHYADGAWLEVDVVSENEYHQAAHKYWKGRKHTNSDETIMEILFCGNVDIVKKHSSWEEFIKNRIK